MRSVSKKHLLKKDLPFAKAGAEIKIVQNLLSDKFISIYLPGKGNPQCYIPFSEKDDWIEEIKPREFFIVISPGRRNEAFAYKYNADVLKESRGSCAEIIRTIEIAD